MCLGNYPTRVKPQLEVEFKMALATNKIEEKQGLRRRSSQTRRSTGGAGGDNEKRQIATQKGKLGAELKGALTLIVQVQLALEEQGASCETMAGDVLEDLLVEVRKHRQELHQLVQVMEQQH